METYRVLLKPISPIHIGSGESYDASEFVNGQGKTKDNKRINLIKRVNVSKYYLSLDKDRQEQFLDNLEMGMFKLNDFDKRIPKESVRYRVINYAKNEPKTIIENIKTMNKAYIPGSSIKGAIKTAILYNKINADDINNISYSDRFLMKKYFSTRKGNSAQNNIMKYLQISDTNTSNISGLYEVRLLKALDTNRKMKYEWDRNKILFLEAIIHKLSFDIGINNNEDIIRKNGLGDKLELIELDNIKQDVYNFSQDLIEYELDFSEKYNIDFLDKFYEKIYKENTPEEPLIRIGAGSGLMSTSIAMKVKDRNPSAFSKIKKVFEKAYDYEFPKSRKVVVKTGKPLGWAKLKIME